MTFHIWNEIWCSFWMRREMWVMVRRVLKSAWFWISFIFWKIISKNIMTTNFVKIVPRFFLKFILFCSKWDLWILFWNHLLEPLCMMMYLLFSSLKQKHRKPFNNKLDFHLNLIVFVFLNSPFLRELIKWTCLFTIHDKIIFWHARACHE